MKSTLNFLLALRQISCWGQDFQNFVRFLDWDDFNICNQMQGAWILEVCTSLSTIFDFFFNFASNFVQSLIRAAWKFLPILTNLIHSNHAMCTKITKHDMKKMFVTIMCRNDELSWTISWVGCLLTDSVLPDKWKLREFELHKFWEEFGYFLQIR